MNLLPILLSLTIVIITGSGILFLLLLTEKNLLQKTLVFILSVFCVIFLGLLINRIHLYTNGERTVAGPLSFPFILMGFVAFFSMTSYYMVAAHRNSMNVKTGIVFLLPVIVMLGVYVVWHLLTGVSLNYEYASMEEVRQNRWSVPIVLRLLIMSLFILYQGALCVDLLRLKSLRKKHSILNSPDAVSNIRWLSMVILGMSAITVCFVALFFVKTVFVLVLYTATSGAVFLFFIDNAIARRMYTDSSEYQLTWNIKGGWKITKEETTSSESTLLAKIDDWMQREKPYCSSRFSGSSISSEFKGTDYGTLNRLLMEQRNENIQSYIRRHRIEEACRIMHNKETATLFDVAARVGFSQQSSFSRAFTAVKDETPLQFMRKKEANH